ncbi:hypothetical protein AVDCRST_MAG82-2932, partial [uncultured Rubrobacteraceae bacterium]
GVAARHGPLLQGDGEAWPRPSRRRGAPELPQTSLLRRRADAPHEPCRPGQGLSPLRLRGAAGRGGARHGPYAPRLRRPEDGQTRQDARRTARAWAAL